MADSSASRPPAMDTGISWPSAEETDQEDGWVFRWCCWLACVVVGAFALLIKPCYKAIVTIDQPELYNEWFVDIFCNSAVLMVCVSMVVSAFFELITRKEVPRGKIIIIVLLTMMCTFIYTLVELALLHGMPQNPALAGLNAFVLAIIFVLGSAVFIPGRALKRVWQKICAKIKKKKP